MSAEAIYPKGAQGYMKWLQDCCCPPIDIWQWVCSLLTCHDGHPIGNSIGSMPMMEPIRTRAFLKSSILGWPFLSGPLNFFLHVALSFPQFKLELD